MRKIFAKYSVPQILILSFVGVILIGTLFLSTDVGLLDALFTATSATCVTGLMTKVALTDFSLINQIVILMLIQIGGLGLMTFVTLTISAISKKLGIKEKIFVKESLNKIDYNGVGQFLRVIFKYTLTIEMVGFLILLTQIYNGTPYSIFQSLFLSVSAFCNAGIDLFGNNSLINFDTNIIVNLTVMVLIVLGGLGFVVIHDIVNRKITLHSKLVIVLTMILIITGTVFIFGFEYNNVLNNYNTFEKIELSLFNSITLRTAGFSTVNYALLRNPTKILMLLFMLIGASPGGTGGGMKTTTFFLLLYSVYFQYKGDHNASFCWHHIKKANVIKAVNIFFMYLVCIFIGILVLSTIEDMNVLDLLFEIVSAIGTVGLSTGITSSLSSISKIILIILMFIGRLGPITVILSFGQNTVQKKIKYPSTEIMVG